MNLRALASLLLISAVTAVANPIGTSITISDNNYSGSGWYSNREDNETETNPNTITSQVWDLEGMYLRGNNLTLVGGFDFRNGTPHGGHTYRSGDIFIDVTGNAVYGQAANGTSGVGGTVKNTFGYDYVMKFNPGMTSYSVFQLNSNSVVARGTDVASSNPWRYVGQQTGPTTALAGFQNVAIGGYGLLSSSVAGQLTTFGSTGTGLLGDVSGNNKHYFLTVDLSFLSASTATFHYTIECGNDNLMGRAQVPEAGTTVTLLGAALLGLAAFRRRFV